jgi:hypothetical protein
MARAHLWRKRSEAIALELLPTIKKGRVQVLIVIARRNDEAISQSRLPIKGNDCICKQTAIAGNLSVKVA